MLDVACGYGRHAVRAAARGAQVTAIDVSPEKISAGRVYAGELKVNVNWIEADLNSFVFPEAEFDVVMMFRYLDRERFPEIRNAVRPGGYLIAETFLRDQPDHGWGPRSEDHLLKPGELLHLVRPFEVIAAREVMEIVEARTASLASVVAQRTR